MSQKTKKKKEIATYTKSGRRVMLPTKIRAKKPGPRSYRAETLARERQQPVDPDGDEEVEE